MIQFRTDQTIENYAGEVDGVHIKLSAVDSDEDKSKAFLATATVALTEFPVKDKGDKLIIDNKLRQKCEFGIFVLSNLLSVADSTPKCITA